MSLGNCHAATLQPQVLVFFVLKGLRRMASRISPPNYTQIPNVILDDFMAEMDPAEFKVVMAIARQTFGWHKQEDQLSLSQISTLTGLSRQGVINSLNAGIKRGIIARRSSGQSFLYRLVVNSVDQPDSTSQLSLPALVNSVDQQLVNSVDSQKKQEKKDKETTSVVVALTPDQEAVATITKAWQENMSGTLTPMLVERIVGLLEDYNTREILTAMDIAVAQNKRTIAYVSGILRRGVDVENGKEGGNQPKRTGKVMVRNQYTGELEEVEL